MYDLSRERKTATPRVTLRKPCSFSDENMHEILRPVICEKKKKIEKNIRQRKIITHKTVFM